MSLYGWNRRGLVAVSALLCCLQPVLLTVVRRQDACIAETSTAIWQNMGIVSVLVRGTVPAPPFRLNAAYGGSSSTYYTARAFEVLGQSRYEDLPTEARIPTKDNLYVIVRDQSKFSVRTKIVVQMWQSHSNSLVSEQVSTLWPLSDQTERDVWAYPLDEVIVACRCGYELQVRPASFTIATGTGSIQPSIFACTDASIRLAEPGSSTGVRFWAEVGYFACPSGYGMIERSANQQLERNCVACDAGKLWVTPWVAVSPSQCESCSSRCSPTQYYAHCDKGNLPVCKNCAATLGSTAAADASCRNPNVAVEVCNVYDSRYNRGQCEQQKISVSDLNRHTNCSRSNDNGLTQYDSGCDSCSSIAQTCSRAGAVMFECTQTMLNGILHPSCLFCHEIDDIPSSIPRGFFYTCSAGWITYHPCSSLAEPGRVHITCGNGINQFNGQVPDSISCNDPTLAPTPYGVFLQNCTSGSPLGYASCATHGATCDVWSFQVLCGVSWGVAETRGYKRDTLFQLLMGNQFKGLCILCQQHAIDTCLRNNTVLAGCGLPGVRGVVDPYTWVGATSGRCVTYADLNSSYCDSAFTSVHGHPATGFHFSFELDIPFFGRHVDMKIPCAMCNSSRCGPLERLRGCGAESAGLCTVCNFPDFVDSAPQAQLQVFDDDCNWGCRAGYTFRDCSASCTSPLCAQRELASSCVPPFPPRCLACSRTIPDRASVSGSSYENRLWFGDFDFIPRFDVASFDTSEAESIRVVTGIDPTPVPFEHIYDRTEHRPLSNTETWVVQCPQPPLHPVPVNGVRRFTCSADTANFLSLAFRVSRPSVLLRFPMRPVRRRAAFMLMFWAVLDVEDMTDTVTINATVCDAEGVPVGTHVVSSMTVALASTQWQLFEMFISSSTAQSAFDTWTADTELTLQISMLSHTAASGTTETWVNIDDVLLGEVAVYEQFTGYASGSLVNSVPGSLWGGHALSGSIDVSVHVGPISSWANTQNISTLDRHGMLAAGVLGGMVVRLNDSAIGIDFSRAAELPQTALWSSLSFSVLPLQCTGGRTRNQCTVTVTTGGGMQVQERNILETSMQWARVATEFDVAYAIQRVQAGSTINRFVLEISVTGGVVLLDNILLWEQPELCMWSCGSLAYRDGRSCVPCFVSRSSCQPTASRYPLSCSINRAYERGTECADCESVPEENARYVESFPGSESCSWVCNAGFYHTTMPAVTADDSVASGDMSQDAGPAGSPPTAWRCQECTLITQCDTGHFIRQCASTEVVTLAGVDYIRALPDDAVYDSSCELCTPLDDLGISNAEYVSFGLSADSCPFECNPGFFFNGRQCQTCTEAYCDRLQGFWRRVPCSHEGDTRCVSCGVPQEGRRFVESSDDTVCVSTCVEGFFPCSTCETLYPAAVGVDTLLVFDAERLVAELRMGIVQPRHGFVTQPALDTALAHAQFSMNWRPWSAMLSWTDVDSIFFNQFDESLAVTCWDVESCSVTVTIETQGHSDLLFMCAPQSSTTDITYMSLSVFFAEHDVVDPARARQLVHSEDVLYRYLDFNTVSTHRAVLTMARPGIYMFELKLTPQLSIIGQNRGLFHAFRIVNLQVLATPRGLRSFDVMDLTVYRVIQDTTASPPYPATRISTITYNPGLIDYDPSLFRNTNGTLVIMAEDKGLFFDYTNRETRDSSEFSYLYMDMFSTTTVSVLFDIMYDKSTVYIKIPFVIYSAWPVPQERRTLYTSATVLLWRVGDPGSGSSVRFMSTLQLMQERGLKAADSLVPASVNPRLADMHVYMRSDIIQHCTFGATPWSVPPGEWRTLAFDVSDLPAGTYRLSIGDAHLYPDPPPVPVSTARQRACFDGLLVQGLSINVTDPSPRWACLECEEADGALCFPCNDIDAPPDASIYSYTDSNGLAACRWVCEGDFVLDPAGTSCLFCPVIQCPVGQYMSACGVCSPCSLANVPVALQSTTVFVSAGTGRFSSNCDFTCVPGLFRTNRPQSSAQPFSCTVCSETVCPTGTYTRACSAFSDRVCVLCSECGFGEVLSEACSDFTDTQCQSCAVQLPARAQWSKRGTCEWECNTDGAGLLIDGIVGAVFNNVSGECQLCQPVCAAGFFATNCTTGNSLTGCEPCVLLPGARAIGSGQLTSNSCPWTCDEGFDYVFNGNYTSCETLSAPPPLPPTCTTLTTRCADGQYPALSAVNLCECRTCPQAKPNGSLSVWLNLSVTRESCQWACLHPFTKSADRTHCVQVRGMDSILRLRGSAPTVPDESEPLRGNNSDRVSLRNLAVALAVPSGLVLLAVCCIIAYRVHCRCVGRCLPRHVA